VTASSTRRALVVLVALLGCSPRAVGPVDTVHAYAQSLREGRLDDAWMHLSAGARAALPYENFVALARAHPESVQDAVRAFGEVSAEAPITARVELASGETVTLLQEGGQWRLDPAALDFYSQRTPQTALRAFVRALERQRWEVLLDLAPRAELARLEAMARESDAGARTAADVLRAHWAGTEAASTQQTLTRLRDALERGRAVEVIGDRATMRYGVGLQHAARLVREEGLWRVEDPE